jgi:hypothetical protein
MAAIIKIDQSGRPAGVAGQSRSDGLSTGAVVTLTSVTPGTTNAWQLLWTPDEDTTAAPSLVASGVTSTFTPSTAVYGTYRIQLTVDATLPTESISVRTFAVLTPGRGLRIPALNERASADATLVNGASYVVESETNEPIAGGHFAAGSYGGYYSALRDLYLKVEAISIVGDVVGPVSSVNDTIPLFNGVTGKLLKQSVFTVSALAVMSASLAPTFTADSAAVGLDVTIAGGVGTAGNGGRLYLRSGQNLTGNGADVIIDAAAGLSNGFGGTFLATGGAGHGMGFGGDAQLQGGPAFSGGTAGGSVIRGGTGADGGGPVAIIGGICQNIGPGGNVSVSGGGPIVSGPGGNLTLYGGDAVGAGNAGGFVEIYGGYVDNSGAPGYVTIRGANLGGVGGTVGGDVFLAGGQGSVVANDGSVFINRTQNDNRASRLRFVGDNANVVSIKAPASVTGSYGMTWPAAQGAASTVLTNDGSGVLSWASGGSGLTGPGSSTNKGIATWTGTGGTDLVSNNITVSGQTISTPGVTGFGNIVTLAAGDSTSAGVGGTLTLRGGLAANNFAGGLVAIVGGSGDVLAANSPGGNITITGGSPGQAGIPGSVTVAGAHFATGVIGGDVILRGGRGPSAGADGAVKLENIPGISRATRLQFLTGDGGFTVSLKAPSTASNSYELTWPTDQGAAFTTLQNNGSGVLTWAAAGAITALSGDVTASGTGTVVATIANAAVTNAKLANVATQTFKGRATAGTGSPEDLTATQATALLNTFTSGSNNPGLKGLVTAPLLGDVAKFLRGDGVWATPAGGGTVTGPVSSVNTGIATWSGTSGTTLLSNSLTISGQTISRITESVQTALIVRGGTSPDGTGGSLLLFGGTGGTATLSTGGGVSVVAASGGAGVVGNGGSLDLISGQAFFAGSSGGPINITAGDSFGGGATVGGSITLQAGLGATPGNITLGAWGYVRISTTSSAVPLQFQADSAGGLVSIKAPTSVTSYTLKLPSAQGSSGSFLQNDGAGALSWSGGGVTGPGSSNIDAIATWSNTSGTALKNTKLLASDFGSEDHIQPIDEAAGRSVRLIGGTATTSALTGGTASVLGGLPGATGFGGSVIVAGTRGGLTSGDAGSADFRGGDGYLGAGGYARLRGGNGGTEAGAIAAVGGFVEVIGGAGAVGFAGGNVKVQGGGGTTGGTLLLAGSDGNSSQTPGLVTLRGGDITSGVAAGGPLAIRGGNALGNAQIGGAVSLTGGLSSAGPGGPVVITGGAAATTGVPGSVTVAGAGFGTGGTVGANVILQGGRGSTLANDGIVQIARTSTDNRASRLQFVADDANTISVKAPATAASYALVLPTAQGAASTVLQNDGSGTLSWSAVVQNLVMTLQTATALKVTEVAGGGMYFDPTVSAGAVVLRMVGSYISADAASSARVYLYDMGPGTGVFTPVRRAVVSIPFASVGSQMKIDQALTKVATPGVDLNEIHNVARVYELRLFLNATDAVPTMTVSWAGFVVG